MLKLKEIDKLCLRKHFCASLPQVQQNSDDEKPGGIHRDHLQQQW